MIDVNPFGRQRLRLQRSRHCNCCDTPRVRDQVRIGTDDDPDYAVAVCPTCDTAPEED